MAATGLRAVLHERQWGQIEQANARGERLGDTREIVAQLLYVIAKTIGLEPAVAIIDLEYTPRVTGKQTNDIEIGQVDDILKPIV